MKKRFLKFIERNGESKVVRTPINDPEKFIGYDTGYKQNITAIVYVEEVVFTLAFWKVTRFKATVNINQYPNSYGGNSTVFQWFDDESESATVILNIAIGIMGKIHAYRKREISK